MQIFAEVGIVATIVTIIAGIVQVVQFFQDRNRKKQLQKTGPTVEGRNVKTEVEMK